MSADRANLALIQDEDVLRKMWADTEDFSKKKEIRSHMYKLREKRLKEFYNSGEIIESKTTKTSNKVSQSSTHADSLIDQSFNSLKSKEVRDSESPTRDIHYKAPDNNEWQISTNKEISKDGKTKVSQTVAAVQGSQKIDGGQLDFKARNEQMSSVYEDGNTKATTNKFQASESSSSHVVKNIPAQPIEYPSNLEEGTKVSRESKTLPDGSVVTTTRYDTKGGASQTCVQSGHVTTSQTSSSSRSVNQSKSSSEFKQTGNKVIRASNDLPEDTVAAVTRYDTQTGSSNITRQSNQLLQAQTSSNRQFSDKQSSYTTSDVPSNLQGVTKVTRETKTLPDGSTVTTTRYDTTGATSHSEVRSNVKVSKDHDFATSRSTRHSEQASVKEYGTLVDNQKHIDQNVIQDRSTENRSTVISSDERKTHNVDQSTSKVTKEHYTNENIVNRVCLDETDGNKISHVVHTSMKQPTEVTVKNVTTQKDHVTEKVHMDNVDINEKSSTTVLEISEFPSQNIPHAKESPNTRTIGDVNKVTHIVTSSVKQPTETVINITNVTTQKENASDNFVNIERQQEQITRDQKVEDTIIRPTSTRPRGRSPVKTPRSEYEPSKSTEGQYDTTYRADYTTKKISVELSPVHDAFARSLRNTSPDRTPSRGSHRTSNSSLPEKMRHPSRYSPERYQKDRSVSPTKSDHKGQSMKRTASNETITISTAAKFDVTRKKETTRKSSTDVITKSRSPSPSKIRSGDIITNLDNDVCITTTTIREKSTTGARPTSLELTKKSRKITDRSPSSPLSDAISPKRSPTKEVRRSSSFRSPTKDSPSPHGKFDGPRRSSLKSPKKETSPSKTLPEDRPLKRTDTYEERCRQILGITEVSDKRKSSLERSSSKRNSFRRNLSSTNVDATSEKIKSPTKEPLKSPTKESDKRRPSSRPTSKDFTADVTLETIVTQKTVTGDKPTKKSSISEFPSQRRSPTRDSQITVEITTKSAPSDSKPSSKRPQISEFPSQRRFPSKETLNKKMDKTVSLEDIVTQEKVTEEYKSTKRPEITEFPSQKRSPSKESLKTQTDKTISVEDIFTTETVTHSDDVTDSKRVEISKKGPSISEFPSQIRHPKDKPQQTASDQVLITSKFITNEKINRNELVSSTEDVISECDLITVTTSTKSISKDEKPSKKPTTESKLPKKDIPRSDEQPKKKGPSIKEFPSQIRSPSNKINTNKFITQEKLATDEITTSREDITKSTTNFSQDTVDTEDITDIIEDIIITDDISKSTIKKPTKKSPSITEFPSQTRPTQKDTTDFVREVTVTDEFDINISKSKPSDEKPKEKRPISEFPSQIRKVTEQKEIVTRNISPGKIAPKEKPKISEFPSQIRREKIPVLKEPQITAKHVEPISYEGRIPVEEPLCVKRRINTDCPGDDHKHVKKIIPSNTKKLQKQYSVDKPEKKSETPINKKPMNGLTEYKSQYTSPKFAPKTKPSKPEETDKVFKPSNKINTFPTKSIKPLVNGVCSKQDKIKEISKVYLTSTKPEKPVSETIIKKTSKSTLLKENESPEKPKKLPTEKVTRITPVRGATPTTKLKSSHPEVVKKHLVTTTITLNNGHQTKSPKPKEIPRRSTNYPKKTTGSKQQKNELSTETDEESFVEEMTENVEVTRKNVAKVNKKLDKKCITTKTVIINNNDTQAREIVVDLQRSTSSREPTPDRVCPVPLGAENGEIEFARYPDEIVEPEEDNIKRKPKRLSDIPLIEYEDTTNFSRITEIVDSHVITERDKVDHTDESLLSVNRKINLFSDTAEKLTKDNKKSSGPAPKVDRPKLPVTKGLESDECLLSVSEKVNKFVNTAEQFMNVHEAPERPKSPRCKFNDDKVNSKTFITKEKKTVEEQNTRKISLENLNVDTKKITDRKPNRTASPEYPNYGTITKKVSLENLDSKSCTKPQEYIRTKSPDRKSPTRSDFTSKRESTTKEVSSVDKKFQSREQSPEPKQITPNRRPSNEYASIKTQEKSTRKNISPEPTDATPKSGKTKTVEDKRTILSSTGRLRSTESIKKARELFENISKKQETVRPSSRSPNLNRNVTTKESVVKKLVYSSEDNKSGRSRSTSPEKGDNPHYMLPLDRRPQSPERENTDTSSVHNIHYVHTEKGDIPHYMLPLDRRPQSPQREGSATSSVHDLHVVRSEKGDIPHYMSPLDRRPHSPERETSATTSVHHSRNLVSGKGDIPRYMSPLDRPHSSERENTDTSSVHNIQYVHTEKGDIPHYMLPLDRRPQSPQREGSTTSSVHDLHVVRSEKGEVPHYMSPLDRRPHSPERETSATTSVHHSRNATSGKGDIPHYMLPLDRRPQSPQREGSTTSSVHDLHVVRSEKGEVPHYMSPLDRRPHSPERETPVTTSVHQSRHVISGKGDIPHYMLPLDRRPESPQREGSTTSSVHDLHVVRSEKGDTPHYMSPLDRRPHSPERETPTTSVHHSRNVISGKGDIPHYMSPLERRPQSPERENTDTTSDHNMHYVPTEKGEIPHYMLPLDRSQSPERENTDSSSIHNMHHVHTDKGDIPHYMLPLDRRPQSPQREGSTTSSAHDLHVVRSEKGDIPHYMSPLDRRPHSPERDSKTTKFGVTLRKTPTSSSPNTSHPASTTPKTSIERRFGNIETLTEEDIQDIFEIEILEELIQIITSYEIRRIIRIQIRLVKKLILENRLTTYIQERKQLKTNKKHSETATKKSEFHSNYSYNEKRQSSDSTAKEIRKQSPVRQKSPSRKLSEDERITTTTSVDRTSVTETRKQSPTRISSPIRKLHPDETITRSTYTVRKSSVDKTPEVVTKKTEEIRKSSPERITKTKTEQIRKTSTTKTTYTTEKTTSSKEKSPTRKLEPRKTSPERKPDSRSTYSVLKKTEVNKKKVDDNKPEWVTQRNLKKVATSSASDKSKTTSSKTVAKQEKIVSTSNRQPTDLITSSYGVGPTDENGTPLFGLKALRTQNNNSTTKVQGTVIKSEYYSENGQEPVGQISVTKYSTDPRDLSTNEQIENNNFVTSVTTTQQFGYEDTPSLDALTSEKIKTQVEDSVDSSDRSATFKRQNSVKAISQKFIDSTVDSLKNERQTSYPKAGLILRTSSFKDSKSAASNEEDTSAGTITSTKTTKRTTATKTTSGGGTFLSNKSTISGVQDVISRMKTEEYQEGESSEDAEARNLLNKFLGSQVLLSGMENRGSSTSTTKTSKTTEVVPTSGASTRKTIKITKTITEGGKTKTKNLVFQSPITEEELDSIWDEQTLRLLLDQSTEYEERRFIRNRLKIIMAEQEACAELVEQASEEQSTGKIEETVNIEKSTTESPVTTTTQVTKVTTQQQITKKPLSPFAKFRQLDKQNSLNTPPSTPGSPKTPGNGPLFKFTDPAVSLSASTIKERLLFWCRMKTKEYENVQLDNFSSSWADGLAFCALIHHFLPDAFDYHTLTPKDRRHNFELAFRVASEKADIFPLLDVEDMMALRKPDWKCVFTYVQSIHRRFKNEEI